MNLQSQSFENGRLNFITEMFFARYALWHLLDLYSAEIFEHGKCLSLYIPHCTPHTTSTRIQQQTPNSSTTTTTTEIALRSVRDLFPSLDGGQIMPSTTFVGRDQTPRLNAHAPSSQTLLMICHNWCWQCHAECDRCGRWIPGLCCRSVCPS